MSILTRIANTLGFERRAGGDNYWENFSTLRSAGAVTAASAQGVSAVYACVQAIAETTASLPLVLFRRDGDDRQRATDHPLYRVLHDQANDNMTALECRELMQASVLLRGNAFAKIIRGYDGQVRALIPLNTDRVNVLWAGDGLSGYEYTDRAGKVERFLPAEVLHLRNRLGDDGVLGVSPISAARGVIELAISEQAHGVASFNNGTRLSGILKIPGKLTAEQKTALATSWGSMHAGGANHGKTAILESGAEYQTLSMTLEDADWIEARKLSVIEVCRLFRVPPVIVQSMESANYSNSVELARQFVTLTLRRHLVAWEQSISKQLLTEAGRRIYFAEHQVEGLLRGDSSNRADFYSKGIAAGWMLKSEARRYENLPTLPGIDDSQTDKSTPSEIRSAPWPVAPAQQPIIVNMPEQPSPVVNVVANVTPSEVIVHNGHPSRAVQTVERDANGDIAQTVIEYDLPA